MSKKITENLTADQLSARWGGSPSTSTLRTWRRLGRGPRWFHVGGQTSHVLYPLADVITYELAQRAKAAGGRA